MGSIVKNKVVKFLLIVIGCVIIFYLVSYISRVSRGHSNRLELTENIKDIYEESKDKNNLLIGYKESLKLEESSFYELPVPLINQLQEPALKYGCEVTSLSMLLSFFQLEYSKNELQDLINKEFFLDDMGNYGDPDVGFVGDATGNTPGTGVNVGPIVELTEKIIGDEFEVINSSGKSIDDILRVVANGNPVWIVTSIDYSLPKKTDFIEWKTRNGVKQISVKHHAAVVIGFDGNSVLLNDAFGKKISIDKEKLSDIYTGMGSQSMYVNKIF